MDKKILFFDIDGTLANTKGILPSNKEALTQLRTNNHSVMISSGRPSWYIKQMFGDLIDGFIGSNGCYIEYRDKIILDKILEPTAIERIISICNEVKCSYAFVSNDKIYVGNEKYSGGRNLYGDFGDRYTTNWKQEELSVYMFDLYYTSSEHLQLIRDTFEGLYIINDHHEGSADASSCTFNKGDAVTHLLNHLGIDKKDSYAFGDGDNDINMFHSVGTAVAMSNGTDTAKQAATYITDDIEEEGISKALVHFNLI